MSISSAIYRRPVALNKRSSQYVSDQKQLYPFFYRLKYWNTVCKSKRYSRRSVRNKLANDAEQTSANI